MHRCTSRMMGLCVALDPQSLLLSHLRNKRVYKRILSEDQEVNNFCPEWVLKSLSKRLDWVQSIFFFKCSCTSVNFKRTRVRGARLVVEDLTGIWVSRRGIEHFCPDGRSFGRHWHSCYKIESCKNCSHVSWNNGDLSQLSNGKSIMEL